MRRRGRQAGREGGGRGDSTTVARAEGGAICDGDDAVGDGDANPGCSNDLNLRSKA